MHQPLEHGRIHRAVKTEDVTHQAEIQPQLPQPHRTQRQPTDQRRGKLTHKDTRLRIITQVKDFVGAFCTTLINDAKDLNIATRQLSKSVSQIIDSIPQQTIIGKIHTRLRTKQVRTL
jgi:hypothetical protein